MTTTRPPFGDYQLEIYLDGLRGVLPAFPMAFAELEARAAQALPPSVLSYVAGGAGSEHTQRANVSAFGRWGLIPRMFVGAVRRDLSVELFGMTLPSPLLMAPIGVIGLCAQDGHGDLFVLADDAAQRPQVLDATEHHDMREKLHRLGKRPLRILKPHDAAGDRQQLGRHRQGLHGGGPLSRRRCGVNTGRLAGSTARTAACNRSCTSPGTDGTSPK